MAKHGKLFPKQVFLCVGLDSVTSVLYIITAIVFLIPHTSPECDRKFINNGQVKSGTFEAPTLSPNYEGHARQCVYTFVGLPGERVELQFTEFNLRGTPPDCNHEYIDLYAEIKNPNMTSYINSPFGGRYCGYIPPRKRVSLYRTLVIGFYTDKNLTNPGLFRGNYKFIDGSNFSLGELIPSTTCSFTIQSDSKRKGSIMSPTYPGVYPKGLNCSYKLLGKAGQRVRIEFRDFDLFYGGAHCPFDYLQVYDGPDSASSLIGTYCGQQRNLVVYSNDSKLFLTFTTLKRTADSQNRGFSGIFEFSESFVKLDFITKSEGQHIRGTECDQRILSKKESNGTVVSPNYPYPYIPKIVCKYFIYGMQDQQNLERVHLDFDMFDIPGGPNDQEYDPHTASEESECEDGFLKLYVHGQETTMSYDKYDYEFCGNSFQSPVISDGPRLVMIFSSGQTQGRGFKAQYKFETEYLVPGTPAPNGSCIFTYRSISLKQGDFNSPRHPANYPSNTTCTYLFLATPNEQVRVVFDQFKVKVEHLNETFYGSECQEDWLEIYNLYKDNTEGLIGRYCGVATPGPLESNQGAMGLKIVLYTNEIDVQSGFKGRYMFQTTKSVFGDCGRNISNAENGIITTPNFPEKYDATAHTCTWYVHVRPQHKILLHFLEFKVEGDPSSRGCPGAAVRVWKDQRLPPLELCGEKLLPHQRQMVSESNILRITFITANKAIGSTGFRAVWTEVEDIKSDGLCEQYECELNEFCISEKLKCNSVLNCGVDDESDEAKCIQATEIDVFLLLGIGLGVAVVILIGLCVCCHRKRKRRRSSPGDLHQSPNRHMHVCDHHASTGARFASVDSV